MTTDALIRQVESLGYVVKTFRVNDTVEMHAVLLEPDVFHVARCNDGDVFEEMYRCTCLLARACGIDLEDGSERAIPPCLTPAARCTRGRRSAGCSRSTYLLFDGYFKDPRNPLPNTLRDDVPAAVSTRYSQLHARRILPETVLGSSENSMRRIRL